MQYLVSTYTNPGDTVLDPFCGGGATLVAAKKEWAWANAAADRHNSNVRELDGALR